LIAARLAALLATVAVSLGAQTKASQETQLQRLPRLGTIAYITAHPDDESGPMITYLARGLHARVVILCLTRGEGGQNMIGPELREELGEVRTREFERVVAGSGAEVRFVGARDFGYSRSVEETLRVWDEKKILGALVRQIRELRPLVVISNWSGTPADGSAHHQAAGLLARHAFGLAGEPEAFPEQFEQGYQPWQARYLLVRARSSEKELTFEVPVGQPSPVPGKTYEELGWESFREHRSQGMHRIQLPRGWRHYLRVAATLRRGPPPPASAAELVPDLTALPELFPAVAQLQEWRARLAQVVELAEDAQGLMGEDKPDEAALALVQGAGLLTALRREIPDDPTYLEAQSLRALLGDRANAFIRAAAALAGVTLEALTDRAAVTLGEQVWVGLAVRVGAPSVFRAAGFTVGTLRLQTPEDWNVDPLSAEPAGEGKRAEFIVTIPEKLDPRQVAPAPLGARAALITGTQRLELTAPVQGLSQASVERPGLLERFDPRRLLRLSEQEGTQGEPPVQLEPANVTPAVTLKPEPGLRLLPASPGEVMREWCIKLEAHRPRVGKISAWFDVPSGWYTPLPKETELAQAGQQATLCFPLTLPGRIPPGRYTLEAVAGWGINTFGLTHALRFAGTSEATYGYEPARATVEILDVNVPTGLRVGFIGFNDDPRPPLLAQLGVAVDLLDDHQLAGGALDVYDAILIASRAYDYREDLAEATPRLLDYVQAGGTLVVEHQGRRWDPARFAPHPGEKPPGRSLRVTDETATVEVLAPEHSLLNFPNRIGEEDWKGWVQERGLYFWESWSDEYTPLLEMADAGQEPLRGSLLYTRYGKGVYIYSGLALFRQVAEGVPGGVRLTLNLLSQSRVAREEEAASAPAQE
jgi:LmbE family N-acetylglucosaminyl deacetylase